MKSNNIKIGVSPLSWMNSDMPELGSDIPVEQCLIDANEIGYEGVELEDPFRKIIDRFPDLLKQYNLSLAAGWHSTFLLENTLGQELESLKKHMDVLSSLGSHTVNLAECSGAVHREQKGLSGRPKLDTEQFKRLGEKLDLLAEYLKSQGFVSAYHHHMGTVIQDAHDVDQLMQYTKILGLLFDTGHMRYAGDCPLEVLQRHINRVTHVHCKNIRSSILKDKIKKDAPFFSSIIDGAFTVPGDTSDCEKGYDINFEAIIDCLVENEYQGWIIMEAEQDPRKADPFSYAKLGYETLKKLVKHKEEEPVLT
jgi:inosose dehydratase